MKKNWITVFLAIINLYTVAQTTKEQKIEDSVLKVIPTLKTEKEIYQAYKKIAETYLAVDPVKESTYLSKAMFIAEQNRDRAFMVQACIDQVDQLLDIGGQTSRQEQAITIANRGIAIAKESQLNAQTAVLLTKKAYLFRSKGNYPEAIKWNEEANNYAYLGNSDSVRVVTELSYANTLIAKDENLGAFKKYINALNITEELDNDALRLNIYQRLADFYAKIKQGEKAKDYYVKMIKLAQKNKEKDTEIGAYVSLIFFYIEQKDFSNAREYLKVLQEKCAASTKDILKTQAVIVEVNLLFKEDINKVPQYIRNNPKLVADLRQWGYGSEADKVLALMYSLENKKDSAEYYFAKSKSVMKPNENPVTIMSWNNSYAKHLERNGKISEAVLLMEKNVALSEQIGSITAQKEFRGLLDSLYIKMGNKNLEAANKLILYQLKDSLDKQEKAKDVLNIEIDAENKRVERENIINAEKLRTKHNLQYMGITAAIISLFVVLAALGKFRVKPWLIRGLGFFSFILLFEFIILLADKQIHHITHGDPLQILLIKIVLIALLLPLHHWLEHKVIRYLMRHRHDDALVKTEQS
jgi:tetratricopeptide (TPR) repeat protein